MFELISSSEVSTLLNLKLDSALGYPALSVISRRLVSSFQEFTQREFEQKERTQIIYVHSTGTKMVRLNALPIESVSSVILESMIADASDNLSVTDFGIAEYGLKLFYKVKNCKITVTYTGGLEEPTEEMKAAALYQLAYEFQSKEHIGAESVINEGGSIYRPPLGLLEETKRMLKSSVHPLSMV